MKIYHCKIISRSTFYGAIFNPLSLTVVDCGRTQTIPYGQITYPNKGATYLGSSVEYSCAPNYNLHGNAKRTCMPNGLWSGNTPKCEGSFPLPYIITLLVCENTANSMQSPEGAANPFNYSLLTDNSLSRFDNKNRPVVIIYLLLYC